jgi:MerR family transcriptional regulator/heat shock protein HspR
MQAIPATDSRPAFRRATTIRPRGTRRYSRRDINRLQEICALTADGLNLAGIRRILQLQEDTRQLRAELAALREQVDGNG